MKEEQTQQAMRGTPEWHEATGKLNKAKDAFVTVSRRFSRRPSEQLHVALVERSNDLMAAQNAVDVLYNRWLDGNL